jgi:hypothetical protein
VAQLPEALAVLGPPFGVNEQHHEAAAAGPKELAAHSAGIAPGLVDFVDLGIRHVAASSRLIRHDWCISAPNSRSGVFGSSRMSAALSTRAADHGLASMVPLLTAPLPKSTTDIARLFTLPPAPFHKVRE